MDYLVVAVVAGLLGIFLVVLLAKVRVDVAPPAEDVIAEGVERASSCVWHYHKFWKWFSRDADGNWWLIQIMIHSWECRSESCRICGAPCQRPGFH